MYFQYFSLKIFIFLKIITILLSNNPGHIRRQTPVVFSTPPLEYPVCAEKGFIDLKPHFFCQKNDSGRRAPRLCLRSEDIIFFDKQCLQNHINFLKIIVDYLKI